MFDKRNVVMQKVQKIENSLLSHKYYIIAGLPEEHLQKLLDEGRITEEEFVLSKLKIGGFGLIGLTTDQLLKFTLNFDNNLFAFHEEMVFHDIIGAHTTIGIVFEDFKVISFVRDVLLAKILEKSFKYLKLGIDNLRKANINPHDACFRFDVQFSEKLVSVDIMCKAEKINKIVINIDNYLTQDVVDRVDPLGTVFIRYIDDTEEIEVIVANGTFFGK